MRSKVKVSSREELLRNFTREFLIEEKRRCEIDRYVTDFRILIHNMPHENHNYLNRLLQDYTSMFLSHERISVNKSNEGEMKHRLMKQVASKMKESPKKRYVKSKSFSNNSENSERQSYLVMKAKTAEFLQNLRRYEELEQIAYEIFVMHSNNEYENKNQVSSNVPDEPILRLKTVEVPIEIPYKKTYKHVYIVNSPETKYVVQNVSDNNASVKSSATTTENLLKNYEYIKSTTADFLKNNRDYNDAEQKILSQQYQHNAYIKKYVDNLNSYNKDAKSPKKGFFYKIKNIMGFSPENSVKTYKKEEKEPFVLKEETTTFLKNEKKFNEFELEAYKVFYMKNGEFQNPLFESNKNELYENAADVKRDIPSEERPEGKNVKIHLQNSALLKSPTYVVPSPRKGKLEKSNAVKSSPPENEPNSLEVMKHIEFVFDPKIEQTKSVEVVGDVYSQMETKSIAQITDENMLEKIPKNNQELSERDINILKQKTIDFLRQQKNYADEQNRFYTIFLEEHPTYTVKTNYKKESLLHKIKQLFKFGKSDKSKEKLYYIRKLTDEFLRNEKYYCDQEQNSALQSTINRSSDSQIDNLHKKDSFQAFQPKREKKTENLSPTNTKRDGKFVISPSVLHQRSRSEDLLTLKSKTRSLDYTDKTSPTGQKSFSDRLKRMVGIGNRRRTTSKENILHVTDPVQYFLDHERIHYHGNPEDPTIYNRSVSLISQSERNQTKPGNFLSTENILQQDRKDGVSGKPPSGRRRQERRSDGEKSKRRSRTLSPAQKLVSKFKNIIHRDGKKKKNEENWEYLRNETQKFLTDQKNFVEIFRKESSNSNFHNSVNDYRNNFEDPMNYELSVREKDPVDATSTDKQKFVDKIYPRTKLENQNDFPDKIKPKNTNGQTKTSSAVENQSSVSPKLDNSITEIQEIVSDKLDLHKKGNSSQMTTDFHDKKRSIFGSPAFSKYQTEIFLHDMKKHNDLNEEVNAVDKTLIFVNNKSSTPLSVSNFHESTGAVPKVVEEIQNNNLMINETENNYSLAKKKQLAQQTTFSSKSRATKNLQENDKRVSIQKSSSHTVQNRTVKNETKVITRKVITEKIQKKSIRIFNVEDSQSVMKNTEDHSQHQQSLLSTEKIAFHRFQDESKKIQDEENKEYMEKQTKQYIKNEKSFSEKSDSVDKPFVEIPGENFTSQIQKNIKNVTTKGEIIQSFKETKAANNETKGDNLAMHKKNDEVSLISNENVIIIDEKNDQIMRSQTADNRFIAKNEVNANSAIPSDNIIDISNVAMNQSVAPMEKECIISQEKVPQSSNFKIKSLKGDNEGPSGTKENNKLISEHTAEFLDKLKKYNSDEYENSLKLNIFWLSDHAMNPQNHSEIFQKGTPTKDIKGNKSREIIRKSEAKLFMKQTIDFLKDHKDYHDRQRNDENKLFPKTSIPEKKTWLSSRSKGLTSKIRKLFSQPISKESLIIYNDQNNQYLRDQTAEFISKHQYFIHKEELKFKTVSNAPDSDFKEVINISKTNTTQSALPHDESMKATPTKIDKIKKSASSKIKSMIGGSPEQLQTKDDHKLTSAQTAEFLEDLRKYSNAQYGTSSKYKVAWLSEQTIIPQIQNKVLHKKISKKDFKESSNVRSDHKDELYTFIKQQNDTFLKNHQDYHNKQRNEDNKFLQKAGIAEENLWFSSKISENKSTPGEKRDISSSTISKKQLNSCDEKYPILRDATAEFLAKNQYFIHKDGVNPKLVLNPAEESVRDGTGKVKMTSSQLSGPEDKSHPKSPTKIKRTKNSTFSKIKSLMGGNAKQPSINKGDELTIEQTAYFLEQLRRWNNNEYEASSKLNIVWLSDSKLASQSHGEILQKKAPKESILGSTSVGNNPEYTSYLFMKQKTDNFLKDHKDYHDRQRIEDNKFFQKAGKPEEKLWLSSNIPKKRSITSKIKEIFSPAVSKKTLNTSEDKNNLLLRDQTAEFLRKNQYLIHEDEVNLEITHNPSDISVEKVTSTQLSAPRDKFDQKSVSKTEKPKISKISKIKSLIGDSTKPSSIETNHKLIREQTAKFLEDSRIYNEREYETSSNNKIVWLSERKINPQKLGAMPQESVSTNIVKESKSAEKDLYKTYYFIKNQTDTFLKDHKNYHDKLKNEENDFFQKISMPEEEFWLSSKIPKNSSLVGKIKELLPPVDSKRKKIDNNFRKNQLLRDQTAEFLRKHQYFIHEDEVNWIIPNSSNAIVHKGTDLSKFDTNQSLVPSNESEKQSSTKPKKVKENIISKMKTLITGAAEKPANKENNDLIRTQTADFLEHLRNYNNNQYEESSKFKITWLSEREVIPQIQNGVVHEIKSGEEICRTTIGKDDQESKLYAVMKQQTDAFLKDHKDYHDKQRIEDNNFLQKAGIPEEKLWLSSYTSKQNSITSRIKKLLSPTISKKPINTINEKMYLLLKDQTAEFLVKNQYLIHEEEVNFKITHNPSDVAFEEVTGLSKVTANQLSAPRDNLDKKSPSKIRNVKNRTFSKIKSLMGGTTKPSLIVKNHELIREQTEEFLTDLKSYSNKQNETSSKDKIVWLSDLEIIPQKLDSMLQKEVPKIGKGRKEGDHDLEYQSYILIKKQTDTFVKDHKDYHDKQRIEDNKFFQKAGKPENKIWLSSNIPNKTSITSKIKKLLSPSTSKKPLIISEDKKYLVLKDQTAEFLTKNRYFIHKEELNPTNILHTANTPTKDVISLRKENTSQSASPRDKLGKESPIATENIKEPKLSKMKSLTNGTAKQSSLKKKDEFISKQTGEFLEQLRKYDNSQYETSSKLKVMWLSDQETVSQNQNKVLQEEISMNRKDREYKSYIFMKQQTDTFLKDHKEYHDNQRNEYNTFLQKYEISEKNLPLSSNIPTNKNVKNQIKKLFFPSNSKKGLITHIDNNDQLRNQTAEFLRKNQYFIHENEVHLKDISNSCNTTENEIIDISKIDTNQSQAPAQESRRKSPTKTEKVKQNTLSKIKSMMGINVKPHPTKEHNKSIIEQTAEFLEQLKCYDNKEYEAEAKSNIVWLKKCEITPVKNNATLQKGLTRKDNSENIGDKHNMEYEHYLIIKQQTDAFLEDLKDYHRKQRTYHNDFLKKWGVPEYKTKSKAKKTAMDKSLNSHDSIKIRNNGEIDLLLRKQTEEFLQKNRYPIYYEEKHFKEITEPAHKNIKNQRVVESMLPVTAKDESMENSHSISETTEKCKLSKLDTRTRIVSEEDIKIQNTTVKLLKHNKENDEASKSAILSVSNEQKQPQIIKKKVTFSDNRAPSENKESDHFKTIIQQTQLFLRKHQDYHQEQWCDYKRFYEQNTNGVGKNTPNLPILSKANYMNSSEQTISSHDSKENEVMGDSSEELLKKQHYIIHEEEIDQNKLKPKPTPRKLKSTTKTNQDELINQHTSSEEYQTLRNNLLLFLQNHQSYHNKERNEHIMFATNQKKHPKKLPKISSAKEQKSKSKLISKLKSLVGGSTEKAKNDDNELKKQTLEFLISQKCFWDLEGAAACKFVEKQQASEKYNQGAVEKNEHTKEFVDKTFAPEMKKKEIKNTEMVSLDKVCYNSTVQSSSDKQNKDYEFLKKQTELFLNNHQIYHDNQMKDFIAFSITRKQVHNEGHNKDKNNQNAKTQNSSQDQKTLEIDNSKKNKVKSKTLVSVDKENHAAVAPSSVRNECEIFLNRQRNYTDSANEGWRRYVMYKPEVAILKKSSTKTQSANTKKLINSLPKLTPKIKNEYSEIESQKIDYEVNLHKTKLFLENHKNYHDNLQNEYVRYVPKNVYRDEQLLTDEKKDGVLVRIKSMLPSSHSKSSYNVQKANLSSQNQEHPAEVECNQVIAKCVESPKLIVHTDQNKEVILKEQTDLFLKDHKEYHNRQKTDYVKYFGNNYTIGEQITIAEEDNGKPKKTKKSVMSKIKSLLGTDTSKKSVNKTNADDILFITPTKLFLEDQKHFSNLEKTAEKSFSKYRVEAEMKNSRASHTSQREMNIENNSMNKNNQNDEKFEKGHSSTNKTSGSPNESNVIREKKYDIPISRTDENKLKETSVVGKEPTNSSNSTMNNSEILEKNITTLSTDKKQNISDNERMKYAREKLQTQEFLLNQKKFADDEESFVSHDKVIQSSNNISKPPKSENIKRKSAQNMNEKITKRENESVEIVPESPINISQNDSLTISISNNSENEDSVKKQVITNEKKKFIPSAPSLDQCENLTEEETKSIQSSLVQRVVSPMSPTKTIFQEIRTRDNSPDNRVFILSEGYTITREGNEIDKTKSTSHKSNEKQIEQSGQNQDNVDCAIINEHRTQEHMRTSVPSFKNSELSDAEKAHKDKRNFQDVEISKLSCTIGQDSSTDSNEYLPSQRGAQSESDLEVRRQYTKRRTYREMEEEPRSFITETRIENNGTVTQRYTTSCYFHQVPTPVWYSESLIVDLEEKSQKINEKVYYDNQLRPDYWSETFETEVPSKENKFVSEIIIPVGQEFDIVHYISLEPQQMKSPPEVM